MTDSNKSNTSNGRGVKGSKFWIQTLVNLDNGLALTKKITTIETSIKTIEWLSPLPNDYIEFRNKDVVEIINKKNPLQSISIKDLNNFWPSRGAWWDAIGWDSLTNTVILLEAKGHIEETLSKCTAKAAASRTLIERSLKSAYTLFKAPSGINLIDFTKIWCDTYYQMGNRLAFLAFLKNQSINVKLVLLNIVNDPTHKSTSNNDWIQHYEKMFTSMIGDKSAPNDVIIVNFEV